jgi:enamine deaminase RidA (YjgF/YER057c/UK114 family)
MKTSLRIHVAAAALALVATAAYGQEANDQPGAEQRLLELGVTLPAVSKPVGIYRRAVVVDNLIHLAGHIPIDTDGKVVTGKVGEDVSLESARDAARLAGLAMLATLRHELGSLDRIERLVKTVGMVNCTPDFVDQPAVVNGCSQLFKDIFGQQRGVGARSAVGMNALPKGAVVEIEAIFEIAAQP